MHNVVVGVWIWSFPVLFQVALTVLAMLTLVTMACESSPTLLLLVLLRVTLLQHLTRRTGSVYPPAAALLRMRVLVPSQLPPGPPV